MAGSTSRQSRCGGDVEFADFVLAPAQVALRFLKSAPLKRLTVSFRCACVAAFVHDLPKALQRRGEMLRRPDHPLPAGPRIPCSGSRPTSSANMVNRQRMRNSATTSSGACFLSSRLRAMRARRSAMSRVTSALRRPGFERLRVGPDRPQPGADIGVAQALQGNGIAVPVRETGRSSSPGPRSRHRPQ